MWSGVGKRGPNLSTVYTEVKRKVPEVAGPFAAWRLVEVHDQQVFQARLNPGLTVHDPQVRQRLSRWPGRVYAQSTPDGVEVTVARRNRPRPRERWWLHLLLLAETLVTATLAGLGLVDGDPLRFVFVSPGGLAIPVPTRLTPAAVAPGLWFSLPLLLILGGHELGHYALARRHGMDVSPPYFIPMPPVVSLIGTFGAFIRLRSPLLNRAVLLDMGAAGPIVGFLLSLPAVLVGLMLSARVAGKLTLAFLLGMATQWVGWLVWAVLILLVGRGRIVHPPVFDPDFRLNGPRRAVAWACIVIFVLTFVPMPFQI